MKILKNIAKWLLYFLLIPIGYVLISLVLSLITVNDYHPEMDSDKSIFLTSNGVHLGIVLPKDPMDSLLLAGIKHESADRYLSFGWGDEQFYLNTPTWGDLTLKNAFNALFLKSPTLVHVYRYQQQQTDWIEIKVSETQWKDLNAYLQNAFALDEHGQKMILENQGYTSRDEFYRALGNYSGFKTCNTWVNTGFKESGLKACYWTPFDFGLMNKY